MTQFFFADSSCRGSRTFVLTNTLTVVFIYCAANQAEAGVRAFRVSAAASYIHQSCAFVLCKLTHLVSYDLLNSVTASFVDLIVI